MLCLEIEYLLGVSFASVSRIRPEPDFPPQPDRVFSALVASWAARGKRDDERVALEWLEALAAPEIVHGAAMARTPATVYVPPNDDRVRGEQVEVIRRVLPAHRKRQPRAFPAVRLDDDARIVNLVWQPDETDTETLRHLNAIAADTSYVGHSSSLTRLAFRLEMPTPPGEAALARRSIYPGRLRQLEAAYERGHRPEPGTPVPTRAPHASSEPSAQSVFSPNWLVLERYDRSGNRDLDLRAAPIAAKVLRDAIMSGYRRIGLGEAIPEIVSGHQADGRSSETPHLAIVPMAFVGASYADGRLFGFALVPPRDSGLIDDENFREAMLAVSAYDAGEERRFICLQPKDGGSSMTLAFAEGAVSKRSLDPGPYCSPAQQWATITPIVLDRHLKTPKRSTTRGDNAELQKEIEGLIADAAERIGLPRPKVRASKHSALEGAPSARPSGNSPDWTRWQVPSAFATRTLVHATLTFETDVAGPVLLGAGRYVGLGLCRPIHGDRS